MLSALRKSCNTLDRLPSFLYLRGVIFHNNNGRPQPVAGGSFSDVYRARWQNIEVAVKVLRTHQISDDKKRKKLRKVSFHKHRCLRVPILIQLNARVSSVRHSFGLPATITMCSNSLGSIPITRTFHTECVWFCRGWNMVMCLLR